MQTLNVGAGRSEADYQATEEKRRADLITDSRDDANYFFWAAGLAALGTGLLPVQITFAVNIGAIDLLRAYGTQFGVGGIGLHLAAGLWILVTLSLGAAARKGQRWAFLAGILIYAADMIALIMMFSIWAFGVHAFFLFKWFEGQTRLREYREAAVAAGPQG